MTTYALLRELRGVWCRCGTKKITRNTFCNKCYWSLPEPMRRALYRHIGEGYEEAYAAAAELLDQAARHASP